MLVIGSWILAAAALVGVVVALVQRVLLSLHLRRPVAVPHGSPGISVLKPLCGIDDALEENLASFAALDWPRFEVLLGVKDRADAAYPVALRFARRHPELFRIVLQEGAPGLNPKVNQLLTLERHARFDLLVISDSNVRVPAGYLTEIAAHLADPRVGLVTHPTVGIGERTFGSLLDNLHMTVGIGVGMIAAKRGADQDLVVGKSMAFPRGVLRALGGFGSLKDVLAEDFVMGRRVRDELGLRVEVARLPVLNISERRSVRDFFARFQRWSVMQRAAVGPAVYLAQALLLPVPLALAALVLQPRPLMLAFVAGVVLTRVIVEVSACALLRPEPQLLRTAAAVIPKELVLFVAWVHGLAHDTVTWRGNVLVVTEGTRLVPQRRPVVVEAEALREAA